MRNSSPVALGEIIAEKYQVEGVLGEGGMGLVVSAWHLGLRQRVAIKLLLGSGGTHEASAIERFQREARAAARIRSEHVCRVLDVGTLANGTPYLVMEYLEGCDLSEELGRRGRLPPAEAIGYVLQACEALAEAHMAGIIHRDLKPANLYLARRPNGARVLKLLDFGVSKSIADASASQFSLTKTSALVGSPIYMSPEQLNSAKDVDARTDIWALGILLYELIAGRTPFYGDSIPQLVNAVLNTEPPSLAELGVSAPGGLEAVLRKALEKSRDRRYANVGELATALGPFAPDGAISVSRILKIRPSTDDRDPLPETVDDADERHVRTPRSARRPKPSSTLPPANEATPSRAWLWALVTVLLVGLAGFAALLSRRLGDHAGATSASIPTDESDAGGDDRGLSERKAASPPEGAAAASMGAAIPTAAAGTGAERVETQRTSAEAQGAPSGPAAQAQGAKQPAAATSAPARDENEPARAAPSGGSAGREQVPLPSGRALPRQRPAKRAPTEEVQDELLKFGGRR